jgi:uncharacterized protein YkwD
MASHTMRQLAAKHWLVSVLVAAVLTCGVALAPLARAESVEDEARLFDLTNEARQQHGVPPLEYDAAAVGVARAWAEELARSGNLRHNPNLAREVDTHVTRDWTRLGENVGFARSPEQVQDAYMNSSGHRDNILGAYNRVGVGAARDANGRLWTAIVFLQAAPRPSAPTPSEPPSSEPPSTVPDTAFAPFPNAEAFAAQQFVDLLSRPADRAGLGLWTNALRRGSTSPATMVTSLVESDEAAMVIEPVDRLYGAYFRRVPDDAGVDFWAWRLRSGATLGQVSQAFASSDEFRTTYGALDDRAFVDLVYRNVLGRGADDPGMSYWLGQMRAGRLDRGGVMVNFSESAEHRWTSALWTDIVRIYLGMLGRAPSEGDIGHWSAQIRNGRSLDDLAATVLGSSEYANRPR